MDSDEKAVLREFFLQAANTIEMPVEDVVRFRRKYVQFAYHK